MALLYKETYQRRDYTVTKVKLDTTKNWVQTTFKGDVQPATGKDLALAPEGNWDAGTVKVYSNIPLNTKKSEATSTYVLFEDDWYECLVKLPNTAKGPFKALHHYKYLASPRTNKAVGL